MIKFFTPKLLCLVFIIGGFCKPACSQNSVLVNFGDVNCSGPAPVSFSFLKNPLSPAPSVISTCSLAAQLPDYYSVFIAYNPLDEKMYVADTRTGVTKIWVLDMNLPSDITCPASIPVAPTYSYSYVSNNFEFDNNGALWSLSNYNLTAGQSNMDEFNVTTGAITGTRVLQFPVGNFPSAIYSGDITILPNGRMFAVLGTGPSRLYEINNYSGTNATATFLQAVPKSCFGIAYLNGQLELTGFDNTGCYYYEYSIANNTLSIDKPFQNGQTPIDNTSISPVIGTSKQLVNATLINANTGMLTYEIYVKNIGNVRLKDITLADDLGAAFGAGNVSAVSTSFISNNPGLTLNPSYNGVTDINILLPGNQLFNQTSINQDYFFKVQVQCTVTNIDPAVNYFNSAVAAGTIGSTAGGTLINVADSSNNGTQAMVDPNNNSNAGEAGENVPTPFNFNLLPVHFLNISARLTGKNTSEVKWSVAVPTTDAASFEPEYSTDAVHWTRLAHLAITDHNRGDYSMPHGNIPLGNVYYRIKQIDLDGRYIYSRTVVLHTGEGGAGWLIYPNPADNFINIISPGSGMRAEAALFDATGRLLFRNVITASGQINCSAFPAGTYVLRIKSDESITTQKVQIAH